MHETHSYIRPIQPEAVLWRYMDFTKFESMLTTQSIYFARADILGDPFEGSLPRLEIAGQTAMLNLVSEGDNPRMSLQKVLAVNQTMRESVFMNCWHENESESTAMWSLYASRDRGIAIKTDVGSLSRSFTCDEKIYIGRVSYVDYERYRPEFMSIFDAHLIKRQEFGHEREVRAITLEGALDDSPEGDRIDYAWHHVETPKGLFRNVDLSQLVKSIRVAPYAEERFMNLVQSTASQFELEERVEQSTLSDHPYLFFNTTFASE